MHETKNCKRQTCYVFRPTGWSFSKKISFLTLMLKNMLEQNEDERG